MKKILFAVVLISTINTFAQSNRRLKKTVNSTITAADMKQKLSVIAGAEMEGRETATEGQRKAAVFIQNYFEKIGLKPPPGGYQMDFPVMQDSLINVSFSVKGQPLTPNKDFDFKLSDLGNVDIKSKSIVYAGFGLIDSARNDFKGLDLKGQWVMFAEGTPEDIGKPDSLINYATNRAARTFSKIIQAKKAGAEGIIIIKKNYVTMPDASVKGQMYTVDKDYKSIPIIQVSVATAGLLLGRPLNSFKDLLQVPSKGYLTYFDYKMESLTLKMKSSNVIGILPGTDKKDEYVFITAHYDHLGKRDSVIYYGADDDGSGTTAVLELAKAFVSLKNKGYRPGRTIVFMLVSGEEKGLWGSEYYTDHPIYPLAKTTVDLNIDMIGRIDPQRTYGDSTNYIYLIGDDKLSSSLAPISDSVNNAFTNLELDRKFNDLNDPNRFYYRSDHFNFAKNDVPVIFYFNGTHADYHRPTDTVEKINFDLMEKRTKLIFYTAWAIANYDEMLPRDIPLK